MGNGNDISGFDPAGQKPESSVGNLPILDMPRGVAGQMGPPTRLRHHISKIVVALLALVILLPMMPRFRPGPGTDSGVFLYVGQQILEGATPYRDVWDHKGPLIYYLNGLGLGLTAGNESGVWMVQVAFLTAAGLLGLALLRGTFGHRPAFLSILICLATTQYLLKGGNRVEEYALAFQFATFYAFWRAGNSRTLGWWAAIGGAMGAAFLLRPNAIGLLAAVIVLLGCELLTRSHRPRTAARLSAVLASFSSTLALTALFFALRGALPSALDAVFTYNIGYSSSSLALRLTAPLTGLSLMAPSGLALFGLAAWLVHLRSPRFWLFPAQPGARLIGLAVVALPLEIMLSSLSGRTYEHYYLPWLPALTVLTAALLADWDSSNLKHLAPAVVTAMLVLPGIGLLNDILAIEAQQHQGIASVRFIDRHLPADGHLLVWGSETAYNFLAKRRSPSPFAYAQPLLDNQFFTPIRVASFVDDLRRHHPLILDTSSTSPWLPPLDAVRRRAWASRNGPGGSAKHLRPLFDTVEQDYRLAEVLQPSGWRVLVPVIELSAGAARSPGLRP